MDALAAYVLVWVRTSTLFLAARPVFGLPGVPPLVRLGLSALTALAVWPAAASVGAGAAAQAVPALGAAGASASVGSGGPAWAAWAYAVGREVVTGLVMAFGVEVLFGAVLLAGQLVDLPMGFSVVNVIDPTLQQETPLIGQFYLVVTTLVFFGVNGHHALIRALVDSLRAIPPGASAASPGLLESAVSGFAQAFVLGVRMGAPIMAALFLADVALAVVARAVPQLNVFVVGFPVKIVLGFGALLLALPAAVSVLSAAFGQGGWAWELVGRLVQSLSPAR